MHMRLAVCAAPSCSRLTQLVGNGLWISAKTNHMLPCSSFKSAKLQTDAAGCIMRA
jgi:hypothetical protein